MSQFFDSRFFHRSRIVVWGALALLTLLTMRAFDIMIVRGNSFRMLADDNRFFSRTIDAHRGLIFDRTGLPLVVNRAIFSTSASGRTAVAHPTDLIEISEDRAVAMSVASPSSVIVSTKRDYVPLRGIGHVVGYIGFGDPSRDERIRSPLEKVGKAGLERYFDTSLRGQSGVEQFEMSANGKLLRLLHRVDSRAGESLKTTIDIRIAEIAHAAMGTHAGAVVVSNPQQGQVLALVSTPEISRDDFAQNLRDPKRPLINRAISAYPPGSTFKMMTALAALSSGKITQDTLIADEGQLTVGTSVFRNWYQRAYGRTEGEIDVRRALARSNDIFFYKAAELATVQQVAMMASRFHIGSETGIELPEEQPGLSPTPLWKEKQIGEKWYLGDTYHMGIGQGYVLASPLQINAMTGALGMRGTWCTPTLSLERPARCETIDLPREHYDVVVAGMVDACSQGGTAFPFFAYNASVSDDKKVACKTGTAEYGSANAQGQRKTHAWLTLVYPSQNPRVAITVFIEGDEETQFLEGSSDAGPIALKVWETWKTLYDK